MKRFKIAAFSATIAMSLAPGFSASAATPFDAFKTVCLAPNADLLAVKTAAASGGWHDTEVTGAAPFPGVIVADKISKAAKADGEPLTLYAYSGVNKAGVHFSECQMRVAKPDFDALNAAAASYAGFAAQDAAPKKATYRFTPAGDGVTAVDKSGFDAAAGAAGLNILTITGDTHGAMIGLLKIKK